MGRRVLQRHIWGYAVCLCPIKRTSGLNELRNEFHLSDVHGAMNHSWSSAKLMNPQRLHAKGIIRYYFLEKKPLLILLLCFQPYVPSLMSMDTDGRVIRFDSFSKLISSG